MRRFLPYNVLGAALWVALWTGLGYTAGNHITVIYQRVAQYELYLGIAVVVLLCAGVTYQLSCRRRRQGVTPATRKDPIQRP